jgi:Flp pilus assembly protein TadD
LLQAGQVDDAIIHYRKALQIKPDNAKAHNNLGIALFQKRRVPEAVAQYQEALRITPDYAEAHNNLGYALLQAGEVDEARVHFQKALQLKPDYVEARVNLGNALLKSGQVDEAIDQYQQALRMRPGNVEAQNNLGIALLQKGRFAEAKDHFQQALQLNANALNVLNNLAWLLATCPEGRLRDGAQAVQYAERACELTHEGAASLVGTLAAAYAEAGRYDEAVTAAEKACGLAVAAGEKDLLERTQRQLALYRTRQSYHEAVEPEFRNRSAVSPGP